MPKRRADLVVLMDILGNLLDGSKGPTRLAQACNLDFETMAKFVSLLLERKFIQTSMEDGRDLYSLTPAGADLHRQYRVFWDVLYPAQGGTR